MDLNEFEINIRAHEVIEAICIILVINIMTASILSQFYVIARELHNMIREQVYRIQMVLEMSHLLNISTRANIRPTRKPSNVGRENATINDYNFNCLSQKITPYLSAIVSKSTVGLILGNTRTLDTCGASRDAA